MSRIALEADFMMREIEGKLIGHKIISALKDPEGSFGFQLDNGTLVWVDQDAEANGPGWLNIEVGRP